MTDTETKFLLYKTDNSNISIDVIISNETLWTTQKAMAELFGVGVPAINKHLKNIYESGELAESATISKMETVQNEGARSVTRELTIYNLDAIISVGYRVNSVQATHFRQWATQTLTALFQ
ncbi:virulence RhuM family protein [Latilactobacillus sakei]|uniref:virulence RhuM family protein n=1 Tax=Latilactobacillus sakei TaxID=1599 RepID=UPI001F4BFE93|nr:RhuM family protein [Latilactobacillus sakei]